MSNAFATQNSTTVPESRSAPSKLATNASHCTSSVKSVLRISTAAADGDVWKSCGSLTMYRPSDTFSTAFATIRLPMTSLWLKSAPAQ